MKLGYLFLLFIFTSAHAACTVTDDVGNKITLAQPATRIISLSPDLTEDLYAIGADKSIVGVIAHSDFPVAAREKPVVGSFSGLDIERIVSLHPDLIVTWGFARQTQTFKNMHIPVYVANPIYLNDITRTINNLGCLTGQSAQATKVTTQFIQQLAQLKKQNSEVKAQRVFFQIGPYSLLTVNKNSWISQAIELCGGKNVFAEVKPSTAEVSWESLVIANPQIIITDSDQPTWKVHWQKRQYIQAVKTGRLFNLPPDLIDRPGPRLIAGVSKICSYLKNNS